MSICFWWRVQSMFWVRTSAKCNQILAYQPFSDRIFSDGEHCLEGFFFIQLSLNAFCHLFPKTVFWLSRFQREWRKQEDESIYSLASALTLSISANRATSRSIRLQRKTEKCHNLSALSAREGKGLKWWPIVDCAIICSTLKINPR